VALSTVVGRNLRAAREKLGMSQDQLARLVRGYGLNWTRSTLAKLERGERDALTVEQLVVLALASMETPARLVEGAEWVALTPGSRMRGVALARLLQGEPAWQLASDFDVPWLRDFTETTERRPPASVEGRGTFEIGGHVAEVWSVADWAAGDAETRAARRLGKEPMEVARAARLLWGRSLADERERRLIEQLGGERLPARSMTARRGHITRELIEELRDHLLDDLADALATEIVNEIKRRIDAGVYVIPADATDEERQALAETWKDEIVTEWKAKQ
jgi:transcriptional regulator with XRE-family HTH domain